MDRTHWLLDYMEKPRWDKITEYMELGPEASITREEFEALLTEELSSEGEE